jgi:hypothetical protein
MVLSILHSIYLFLGLQFHAYYVSVSEIYHNPKTQSLEITMKIFIDDLQLAIQEDGNPQFMMPEEDSESGTSSAIAAYLEDRFIIDINRQPASQRFIGYEFEDDAVLCYIEIENVTSIDHIRVYNVIISEIYDAQINLTHFQYRGQLKSIKTTKSEPDGTIIAKNW